MAWMLCILCFGFAICLFYAALRTEPQPMGYFLTKGQESVLPYVALDREIYTYQTKSKSRKMQLTLTIHALGKEQKNTELQSQPLTFVRTLLVDIRFGIAKMKKFVVSKCENQNWTWVGCSSRSKLWYEFRKVYNRIIPHQTSFSSRFSSVRSRPVRETHREQDSLSSFVQYAESVRAIRQCCKNMLNLVSPYMPPRAVAIPQACIVSGAAPDYVLTPIVDHVTYSFDGEVLSITLTTLADWQLKAGVKRSPCAANRYYDAEVASLSSVEGKQTFRITIPYCELPHVQNRGVSAHVVELVLLSPDCIRFRAIISLNGISITSDGEQKLESIEYISGY